MSPLGISSILWWVNILRRFNVCSTFIFDNHNKWRNITYLFIKQSSQPNTKLQNLILIDITDAKEEESGEIPRYDVSFARVYVHRFYARLALHLATPLERALAALLYGCFYCVVPATATQQFAAVKAMRRSITDASRRTQNADILIPYAVVRWFVQVDQIARCGNADLHVFDLEAASAIYLDICRAIIFFSKIITCNQNLQLKIKAKRYERNTIYRYQRKSKFIFLLY